MSSTTESRVEDATASRRFPYERPPKTIPHVPQGPLDLGLGGQDDATHMGYSQAGALQRSQMEWSTLDATVAHAQTSR